MDATTWAPGEPSVEEEVVDSGGDVPQAPRRAVLRSMATTPASELKYSGPGRGTAR